MGKKLKNALINTGLVIISSLIPLLGLEIYLRVTDTTPYHANALNSFHVADPYIGWKGRPDFKGIHKTPSFETLIEYGPDGYRKAQSDVVPNADAKRIAIMGDSFAWGWGVGQGELFTDHLQEQLGEGYLFKNYGINTFCTVQYSIQLEREVLEWRPETLGMLFYSNDFTDNLESRNGIRPYCEIENGKTVLKNYPVQNPIGSIGRSITSHSYALTTLRYYINTAKAILKQYRIQYRKPVQPNAQTAAPIRRKTAEQPAVAAQQPPVRSGGIRYVTDDETLAFRSYLQQIAETAKRNDIHFFVVYVPTGNNIAKEKHLRRNYLEVVKEACSDLGIDLIDLTPRFEQGLTGPQGEPYYYARDNHWTPKGHALAAEIISAYLLQEPTHPAITAAK